MNPICVSDAMPKHCLRALLMTLRDLVRMRRERQLAPPLVRLAHFNFLYEVGHIRSWFLSM